MATKPPTSLITRQEELVATSRHLMFLGSLTLRRFTVLWCKLPSWSTANSNRTLNTQLRTQLTMFTRFHKSFFSKLKWMALCHTIWQCVFFFFLAKYTGSISNIFKVKTHRSPYNLLIMYPRSYTSYIPMLVHHARVFSDSTPHIHVGPSGQLWRINLQKFTPGCCLNNFRPTKTIWLYLQYIHTSI